MEKAWTHSDLVEDLAEHLENGDYIAREVGYGSSWAGSCPIPDVVRIRKSYARPDFVIYEVKAQRSDFLSELRSGKWLDYLPHCTRFYFATPSKGVVANKSEIPEGAGWISRSANTWTSRITPKIRSYEPDWVPLLALLMAEHNLLLRTQSELRAERKSKHRVNIMRNKKLWSKMMSYERDLERRKTIRTQLMDAREVFKEITGISVPTYHTLGYDLRNWVEKTKRDPNQELVRDLRVMRDKLSSVLEKHGDLVKEVE